MQCHRKLALWCQQVLPSLKDKRILYFTPVNSMNRWLKRKGVVVTTSDLYSADLKFDLD